MSESAPIDSYASEVDLDPRKLPRHIAVIMDGNGRWAVERGGPRVEGHLRGADTVRTIVTECRKLGIGQLTLYCFSAENWKRPKDEVEFLMALFKNYLIGERELLLREQIKLRVIGRREGIPEDVLAEVDDVVRVTAANEEMTLCLAVNYGSRTELVDAVRTISTQVLTGELSLESITEDVVEASLYTAGMPDPDLLIRTAGELRLSNYLLWQISYAEIWVTPLCWPDFGVDVLHAALRDFAGRNRRFGGLTNQQGASP